MKTIVFLAGVVAMAGSAVWAGPLDKAWIKGVTDKDPLTYKSGETMTITLTVEGLDGAIPSEGYSLVWKRSGEDGLVETGRVALASLPFVYKSSTAKPGFVRLQATVHGPNGQPYLKQYLGETQTPEGRAAMNRFERTNRRVFFDGGAGADVDRLRVDSEPSDFEAFWARQYARLDRVPIKADRIELPCQNAAVRLYAVQIACAGLRPVTGYLSIPKDVDKGVKYPCMLHTHGYSGDSFEHAAPRSAPGGKILLNINAHGLKLPAFGGTEADRKALRWECRSNGHTYAFDPAQNADPETAYFNGMVLRVKRALQYLKTLPGWNGRDLQAEGGSQGGLQTIWAAGCGEGVTEAFSGITWCCDMPMNNVRLAGKASSDGWYIRSTPALDYYDAAVFAGHIPATCRTVITRAGLGDYCCPPNGLAKLWNNLKCPREIHWVQGSQHGYVPPVKYPGRDWDKSGR